jgi:hypothetical protein
LGADAVEGFAADAEFDEAVFGGEGMQVKRRVGPMTNDECPMTKE